MSYERMYTLMIKDMFYFTHIDEQNIRHYRADLDRLAQFLQDEEKAPTLWEDKNVQRVYNMKTVTDFLATIYCPIGHESYYAHLRKAQSPLLNGYRFNCHPAVLKGRFQVNDGESLFLYRLVSALGVFFTPHLVRNLFLYLQETGSIPAETDIPLLLRRELTSLQLKGILAAVPLDDLLDYSQYFDMVDLSLGDDVIYFVNPFIATDGNFITLDTFAAFHQPIVQILGTCTAERPKGLDTILFLLSRLTHSRRKYLIRHHCSFESEQSRSSIKVVRPYQCRCIHRHKDGDKSDS